MNGASLLSAMITGIAIMGGVSNGTAKNQAEFVPGVVESRVNASDLLENWGNTVKRASTIEVQVTARTKIGIGGQVLVPPGYESSYVFSFQRPDRVAMVLQQGSHGLTLVCDGKKLHRFWPGAGRYECRELDTVLEVRCTNVEHGLIILPVLVSKDPNSTMFSNLGSISDLGDEMLDGIPNRHLRGENLNFAIDFWFTGSDHPTLGKAYLDLSRTLDGGRDAEAGGSIPGVTSMGTEFIFSDWRLDPELPTERFTFDPPSGVKEDRGESASGSTHPLVEQTAPPFTIEKLDGGTFDLADHLSRRHVVVLDFFATWCGPCRSSLFAIDGLSAALDDEGLVVCAVDLRETPETVRRFVRDQRIDVDVALDSDGKIGELYGVKAIPQTVLIGRDGKVRSVHVGSPASLENVLMKELRELLDEGISFGGARQSD